MSHSLLHTIDSLGYLLNANESKGVNKVFLANTIREVDAHNRREQIDACWRAHGLQKELTNNRKRSREDDDSRNDSFQSNRSSRKKSQNVEDDRQENMRELWARRKLEAFANSTAASVTIEKKGAEETNIKKQGINFNLDDDDSSASSTSESSSSSNSSSQNSSDSRTRKSHRHRRKKAKHDKKKSKHSRKKKSKKKRKNEKDGR
jgi:hypothetical protein